MALPKVDPFHAISDPSRREILMLLSKERSSINTIADKFPISRPAVSKHIKMLHEAGFIAIETRGRERYCELNPDGFNEIKKWVVFFDQFWQEKLKSLENFLNSQFPKSQT